MLKFTIRDLLWLTLLMAVTFGWIVDRTFLYYSNQYHVEQLGEHITLLDQMERAAKKGGYEFDSTPGGLKLSPVRSNSD
jgi:hypothetical protein